MRTLFSGLAILLLLAQGACAHSPPAFQSAEVKNGSLERHQKVWVMQLSGTPQQRGKAAGALVGEQIRWVLPRYLRATLGSAELPGHVRGLVQRSSERINSSISAWAITCPALTATCLHTRRAMRSSIVPAKGASPALSAAAISSSTWVGSIWARSAGSARTSIVVPPNGSA